MGIAPEPPGDLWDRSGGLLVGFPSPGDLTYPYIRLSSSGFVSALIVDNTKLSVLYFYITDKLNPNSKCSIQRKG
jgi:hypothetical protein